MSEASLLQSFNPLDHLPPDLHAEYVRRETGLDVPEGASDFRIVAIRHRAVGKPVKRLLPDQPYSVGLFTRRNPVYTEVEQQRYVTERFITCRLPDARRWGGWFQPKGQM